MVTELFINGYRIEVFKPEKPMDNASIVFTEYRGYVVYDGYEKRR
jgi:hypothetical protein